MVAAYKGYRDCFQLLLAAGKEVVHLKTAQKYTTLDLLAKDGKSSAIGLLIPHVTSTEMLASAKGTLK